MRAWFAKHAGGPYAICTPTGRAITDDDATKIIAAARCPERPVSKPAIRLPARRAGETRFSSSNAGSAHHRLLN